VGEQIRQELSIALGREVHDPGIGFVTLTHVKVSPDLQVARVYYTSIGDEKARRETRRALERATPFLRRRVAAAVRLRRVPELHFQFDESVEKHDRIERILLDLQREREERGERGEIDAPEPAAPGAPEPRNLGTPEPQNPGTPEPRNPGTKDPQ
jgi:ribosome-binding factor A